MGYSSLTRRVTKKAQLQKFCNGDDAFTEEVKQAWTITYVTLSTIMLNAAHEGDKVSSTAS